MATTPHLEFELLDIGQSASEAVFNENTNKLEALVGLAVVDQTTTAPPGAPSEGDRYLVAAGATGAWANEDGNLAYYNSGWKFATPRAGWIMYDADTGYVWVYDGSAWLRVATAAGSDVTDLSQTTTNPPTQAEVQAIANKVDELLAQLRTPTGLLG